MSQKQFSGFIQSFMPFMVAGVAIMISLAFLMLFFYLFLWGMGIGLILFVISLIKNKFFPPKAVVRRIIPGEIYDHDDYRS